MKKLTLSRETVKALTKEELAKAAGGSYVHDPVTDNSLCSYCCFTVNSCFCGSGGPSAPCDQIC